MDTTTQEKCLKALEVIFRYGQIDGEHHKQWLIDQLVRILTGDHYDSWIAAYKKGEDGEDTYPWETGIAP